MSHPLDMNDIKTNNPDRHPSFANSHPIYREVKEERTILDEAQEIVEGQRRSDYGDARTCFNRIAKMWGGYLGVDITAFDVANLMITLKVCRAHGKGFQKDSYTDIAGYSYCAEIIYNQSLSK